MNDEITGGREGKFLEEEEEKRTLNWATRCITDAITREEDEEGDVDDEERE